MEFPQQFAVDESLAGQRLDAALASRLSDFSRAVLRRSIDSGSVTVDGVARKPSFKLTLGQQVVVPHIEPPPPGPQPEAIPLDLLYEDDDLVAVNKPPGMVVHPAKGHWAGTLASALAHHFGENLSSFGGPTRPGIVHRLDRDTSGVIVVAKHDQAHQRLADQFKDRTTEKQYLAIVLGVPDRDADVIDRPIGDHPHAREKKAIRADHPSSREAITRYEVAERFAKHALIRCFPKTGRTHQIRVHMAHIRHPILCDKLYGGQAVASGKDLDPKPSAKTHGSSPKKSAAVLERQALHAERLSVTHPCTGERLQLEAPLPEDLLRTLQALRGET